MMYNGGGIPRETAMLEKTTIRTRYENLHVAFLKCGESGGQSGKWRPHHALADADGVQFACPSCRYKDAHDIICWSASAPPDLRPEGRWTLSGAGPEDLTLIPADGGVGLKCGCRFHITDGAVMSA